jgi:hypothetical protein
VLDVTVGGRQPARALKGATPILFDGRQSTGEGLRYLIDFGDGVSSESASDAHVVFDPQRQYGWQPVRATLTVTDRFGRTDSSSSDYHILDLGLPCDCWWVVGSPFNPYYRELGFVAHEGHHVRGGWHDHTPGSNEQFGHFEGEVTADNRLRLAFDDGRVLEGPIVWVENDGWHVVLTVRGGREDGLTREYRYWPKY